jgi:hypothetical protein
MKSTSDTRNRLGQFATPFRLAKEILDQSLEMLAPYDRIAFLEPALGSGVFFSALHSSDYARHGIDKVVGIELDSKFAREAHGLWAPLGYDVVNEDFFRFASDKSNHGKFNLLCTNPPYVRHHHIPRQTKLELQASAKIRFGIDVSGLSGLYVHFILAAHDLLADRAVASWLIPNEFLSVNYGRALREYLRRFVSLLDVKLFKIDDVQFEDALVSSCVITYRKELPSESLTFTVGSRNQDIPSKRIALSECDPRQKWHLSDPAGFFNRSTLLTNIGDLFEVKRGVATGANDYFILSAVEVQDRRLPVEFLRPILPSPRYLKSNTISADAEGMPSNVPVCFLLDCPLPPDVVAADFPELWAYLEEGQKQGINDKYLCRHRQIWYQQERREPSLFLASYMGRKRGDAGAPIRFFLNLSRAIGANVFLHLYPKRLLKELMSHEPQRRLDVLNMLESISSSDILRNGRSYGGGLHKIEPKELLNVPLRVLPDWLEDGMRYEPGQMTLFVTPYPSFQG